MSGFKTEAAERGLRYLLFYLSLSRWIPARKLPFIPEPAVVDLTSSAS